MHWTGSFKIWTIQHSWQWKEEQTDWKQSYKIVTQQLLHDMENNVIITDKHYLNNS